MDPRTRRKDPAIKQLEDELAAAGQTINELVQQIAGHRAKIAELEEQIVQLAGAYSDLMAKRSQIPMTADRTEMIAQIGIAIR